MKKRKILLIIVLLLIPVFHLTGELAFAGTPPAQGGDPVDSCLRARSCETPTPTPTPNNVQRQKQFAAAQTRNERRQPPGAGRLQSGDTEARSNFSFFMSIFVLLGGILALIALLRQRLSNNSMRKRGRLPVNWNLAFKPRFALSVFGFLFAAAIVGSVLTKPSAVKAAKGNAEKRNSATRLVKSKMTGLANPSNKPVFKSARAVGGDGLTQIGSPVFDAAGNSYVRGGFTGNLTVGAANLHASRSFDAFVAKYDQNGDAMWARQATGATGGITAANSIEGATALAVDARGNVYIGGSFVKTITFQGGTGAPVTLNDNGAAGVNYEAFIAKYDVDGKLLWARGGNSGSPKNQTDLETGQNGINQIVFDSADNPYLTGVFSGGNFFGSATTKHGKRDIVLARLDPEDGAPVWKQIIGGTNDDGGLDLKTDADDNLYLIGNFSSETIEFPTAPATTFTNTDDSTATFIAKFDASGANLWAKEIDNSNTVGGSQIAVSADGEIYLTGYFFDSAEFGDTLLYEEEGESDDEASLGGYLAKMDTNGEFVWAEGFGGIGITIALDPAGKVYIGGRFYDGGIFGLDSPNEEGLASFGGEDIFVARYDTNGNFDWAKPIAGSGEEGTILIGNTADPTAPTDNSYNPLGIGYNPASRTMFVSGDFQRAIALDCQTLTNTGNVQAYVAEISDDSETTSCRIWNGLDEDDNDFDSPDNWNGGVLPSSGDSVFVPYTGNDYDPPSFNPATNIPLGNLTLADERILTLDESLTVNGRLDLLGGFIDAETFPLLLGESSQTYSINDGLVLGRVQKQFAAGSTGAFTFPVGTADNDSFAEYSPVTLSNISGAGSFSVTANRGTYPNTANNLPANRAARWWNLANGGLTKVDLTFKYLPGDITMGMESEYRAFRIPTGGGAAAQVLSTIDTTAKIVFAPNVSQFSDWTLAQQPLAPTAALVSVSGRVINGRRAVVRARVSMTDATGVRRFATTNSFGYYRFADVAAGETYIFKASAKRYESAAQVVNVNEDVSNLNFTGR